MLNGNFIFGFSMFVEPQSCWFISTIDANTKGASELNANDLWAKSL